MEIVILFLLLLRLIKHLSQESNIVVPFFKTSQAFTGDGMETNDHEHSEPELMIDPVSEECVEDDENVKRDEEENAGIENEHDENEEQKKIKEEDENEEQENEKEELDENEEEEENEEQEDENEEEEDGEDKEDEQKVNEVEKEEAEQEDDDESEDEYTTWDGKKVKVEYSGIKLKALRGNVNIEFPEKTQVVRIFTSSTFTGLYNCHFVYE